MTFHVMYNGEAVEPRSALPRVISYIPYGEIFVEQQSGGWQSPYLFNAKELDSETGLYYYGARYLDPTSAAWLSVDPLFEKYVGMSPYGYCAGNPVRLVDPDGETIKAKDGDDDVQYNPEVGNQYSGNNVFVKFVFGILDKINSVSIGHTMLMALHQSDKEYTITNGSSRAGTAHTSPINGHNGTSDGAIVNASGHISFLTAAHELFHCYQYEKGQGGASIFNEIEAYTFSNRLIDAYNETIPYNENYYNNIFYHDSFGMTKDESANSTMYYNAVNSLLFDDTFNRVSFDTALSLFQECASQNRDGLYNNKYVLRGQYNRTYLLSTFFK